MFGALVMTACSKVENAGGVSGGSNGGGSGNGSGPDDGGSGAGSGVESVAWVDLGLPSGLLWASCNLGAVNPNERGEYYAWGEIEPKQYFGWGSYKYCNGSYDQLTKYCSNSEYGYNGFTDNVTILQAADDVVSQKIGGGAHIPSLVEWQELIGNTTATWERGIIKLTSANGRCIILPAAGYREGDRICDAPASDNYYHCYYWANSNNNTSCYTAWCANGSKNNLYVSPRDRKCGMLVRPVLSPR